MFREKRWLLTIFLLLLMGFTYQIADFYAAHPLSDKFWCLLAGVWLAEFLLGLLVIAIPRGAERTLPFHFGNMLVAIFYLIYVFGLIFFTGNMSLRELLLWEVGGALVALFLHILFAFARQDSEDADAAISSSVSARREFQVRLQRIALEKSAIISGNSKLRNMLDGLQDAARCASESVPGSECEDEAIRAGLEELEKCLDQETMIAAADRLSGKFKMRQNIIKTLR